jgi:hypothetical protein
VDSNLNFTWPGQDLTRAQPRGNMTGLAVTKALRLAREYRHEQDRHVGGRAGVARFLYEIVISLFPVIRRPGAVIGLTVWSLYTQTNSVPQIDALHGLLISKATYT